MEPEREQQQLEGTGWWAAPNEIFGANGLSAHDRLVYLYLCRRAGPDGRAWPSTKRIADETGITRRTVQRVLFRLQESGWISVEARKDDAGRDRSHLYRLCKMTQGGRKSAPPKRGRNGDALGRKSAQGGGRKRDQGEGVNQHNEGLPREKEDPEMKEESPPDGELSTLLDPSADAVSKRAHRWLNLLASEPGTRDEKLAWLRRELPRIEGAALAKFADEPTASALNGQIRSTLLAWWRQHVRGPRGGPPRRGPGPRAGPPIMRHGA